MLVRTIEFSCFQDLSDVNFPCTDKIIFLWFFREARNLQRACTLRLRYGYSYVEVLIPSRRKGDRGSEGQEHLSTNSKLYQHKRYSPDRMLTSSLVYLCLLGRFPKLYRHKRVLLCESVLVAQVPLENIHRALVKTTRI